MAVEDVEWQERYGDQSYKSRSILAIRVALFALFFSQVVVLPSIAVYLSTLHASASMLGYCLSATCIGELCANNLFSMWYDKRPAREVVVGALVLNVFASILYSVAPHRVFVLASRFLVGFASGVQAPLMTLVGVFTNRYNRAEILSTVRSTYILAFIVGAGLSTSVTFIHMHNPGLPLDTMQHKVPGYVSEGRAAAAREADSVSRATQQAIGDTQQAIREATAAAQRALSGDDDNVTSAEEHEEDVWDHPLQLWEGAGKGAQGAMSSWEQKFSVWQHHERQYIEKAARNESGLHASVLPASLSASLTLGIDCFVHSVKNAVLGSTRNTLTSPDATIVGSSAARARVQMQAAAVQKASAMEQQQKEQDKEQGLQTHASGPVFHFAPQSAQPANGGGVLDEGLGSSAMTSAAVAALIAKQGLTGGLAAMMADISKKERLAEQAIRQANRGHQGGGGAKKNDEMVRDMQALGEGFGGGRRQGEDTSGSAEGGYSGAGGGVG